MKRRDRKRERITVMVTEEENKKIEEESEKTGKSKSEVVRMHIRK
jgi:hypothetical protein